MFGKVETHMFDRYSSGSQECTLYRRFLWQAMAPRVASFGQGGSLPTRIVIGPSRVIVIERLAIVSEMVDYVTFVRVVGLSVALRHNVSVAEQWRPHAMYAISNVSAEKSSTPK